MDVQTWASVASILAVGITVLGTLSRRIDRVETRLGLAIEGVRTDLTSDHVSLRGELKTDISELRSELKTDISELRTELKSDIAEFRAEVRADLGRVDTRLTGLEQRTFDLAARLPAAPAASQAE